MELSQEELKKYPISDKLRNQIDDLILNWQLYTPENTTVTAWAFQEHIEALTKKRQDYDKGVQDNARHNNV